MDKKLVKKITLAVVALLLLGIMIAGNIVLNHYATVIHRFFAGDNTNFTTESVQNALGKGDEECQRLAEESIVLLKNQNKALPMDKSEKVNLFGYNATDNGFMLSGGGSGGTVIHEDNRVTLTEALDTEKFDYNKELLAKYAAYDDYDADKNGAASSILINPPSSFYSADLISSAKQFSSNAVIVLSRYGKENSGGPEIPLKQPKRHLPEDTSRGYLELSTEEEYMIEVVTKNFDKVIVLLNTCNSMELGFLNNKNIDAALYIGMPGQSGSLAIPRILRGDITPSGKTADTYGYDHQTNDPTWVNAIYSGSNIHYAEGIYFGYKWFETANVEGFFDDVSNDYGKGYDAVVQYPFGYGLSYADFTWEVEQMPTNTVINENSEFTFKVRVTNTSKKYAGKDIVQLYATPPYTKGGIEKAHVNLVAFGKTELLEPGQSQVLTLTFSAYDLASYDDYDKNNNGFEGYELEVGNYEIKLMRNAHTIDNSDNARFNLEVSNEILFILDTTTTELVENRFTGKTAYAGVPIDGSTVSSGIKYLSRNDFEGTFPKVRTSSYDQSVINKAAAYVYDGFNNITKPTQGASGDLRLVTKEDGSNASLEELNGTKSATLKYNTELMEKLSDYDAKEWNQLLNQLTETEIKDLIGKGGFQTLELESVGKPRAVDKDGPAGFNNGVYNASVDSKYTAFPSAALIACSWSPKNTYNMGRAQGVVASAVGINGWYAPGVNLHRNAYNSRNFEYYSEDAVLSGVLAAELIRGAKNTGLYCYIKHFAVSEAGDNPGDKNTWLTEQTLREVYLKPFEIAVKRGGANAIMSAFNRLGAAFVGGNYALSTQILRDEWGFRGTMITDWFSPSYMIPTKLVIAGNDLMLAGSTNASANIDMTKPVNAYRARTSAKNIIYTFVNTYVTASDFQKNGDPNDPYAVNVDKITVVPDVKSPLFYILLVAINVVLAGGIATCVLFIFLKKKKKLQ